MTNKIAYRNGANSSMNSAVTTTDRFYQLPALFNSSWIDDVFGNVDGMFKRAFEQPNTVYPYNVVARKDKNGELLSYEISLALAGIPKEKIYIGVKDNHLDIKIDGASKNDDENTISIRRGISYRNSTLSFDLTEKVDKKNINSSYKDGLLTVVIPVIKPEVINIDIKVN